MGLDALFLVQRRLQDGIGHMIDALDRTKLRRIGLVEGAVRIGNVLRVTAAVLDDLIHLGLTNARGNRIGRLRHLCGTGGNQSSTAIAGVCVICASRCMTGLAHMTAHGAQGDQQLRQHFGTVAASHTIVVQNHDLVALCHNLSQLGDLLRLHAADRLCPFRRLRRAVVLAKDVVLKVLIDGLILRHALGVETNRVLMDEVPIDDASLFLVKAKHFIGNSEHKRHVRAGTNGNPLSIKHLGGRVVQRVDGYELGALVARSHPIVDRRTGGRPSRIGRPHDNVLGVFKVKAIVCRIRITRTAVRGRKTHLRHVKRIRAMRRGIPSAHVTGKDIERGVVRLAIKTRGAVLVGNALDFLGCKLNSFVPADDFPLVLATHLAVGLLATARLPALALERMKNTVSAEALLLLGFAAHATALLRILDGILVRVIGLLANNGAILNHDLVHAATTAVVPAGCGNPFAALCRIDRQLVLVDGLET